jgi:hypothetical protein
MKSIFTRWFSNNGEIGWAAAMPPPLLRFCEAKRRGKKAEKLAYFCGLLNCGLLLYFLLFKKYDAKNYYRKMDCSRNRL